MTEAEKLARLTADYEKIVLAVPPDARKFAAETWGITWAHAEMGSLWQFAVLATGRRHAADIATINILGEENRRLRDPCHPAAEVMPDGLRLTSFVHVGREASDRIVELEAEVQALKDQRLSWCRAADENRRHAVRLEAENKQLRAQLEAARDACKLTRGSKAALAKALGQHL